MNPAGLFLILGAATLSAALRSFDRPLLRKLGGAGVMATSFLLGYVMTGQWWVGVVLMASWLLLPWLEILTRVRNLRLPMEKQLRHRRPPSEEVFPGLDDVTDEVVEEGFAGGDDVGWGWDDYEQFFRLFHHERERCQAALCVTEQHEMAFFYMNISSRGKDGRIWTTWNYPFSYSLKFAPALRIHRVRPSSSFGELYEEHRQFLLREGVRTEDLTEVDAEELEAEVQKDLQMQIAHNLDVGVLLQTGEGQIRYSWRGMLFIYFQFLRDIVRL